MMTKQIDANIMLELSRLAGKDFTFFDKGLLKMAIGGETLKDKTLIWIYNDDGGHSRCFREDQCFIKDTPDYNALLYYAMLDKSGKRVSARTIVPKSIQNGALIGDVFDVDLQMLAKAAEKYAVDPETSLVIFEDGTRVSFPYDRDRERLAVSLKRLSSSFGGIVSHQAVPREKDAAALSRILADLKIQRDDLPEMRIVAERTTMVKTKRGGAER